MISKYECHKLSANASFGMYVADEPVGLQFGGLRRGPARVREVSFFLCNLAVFGPLEIYHGEFDPGSERTLAACLKHASRAARVAIPLERRTGE